MSGDITPEWLNQQIYNFNVKITKFKRNIEEELIAWLLERGIRSCTFQWILDHPEWRTNTKRPPHLKSARRVLVMYQHVERASASNIYVPSKQLPSLKVHAATDIVYEKRLLETRQSRCVAPYTTALSVFTFTADYWKFLSLYHFITYVDMQPSSKSLKELVVSYMCDGRLPISLYPHTFERYIRYLKTERVDRAIVRKIHANYNLILQHLTPE